MKTSAKVRPSRILSTAEDLAEKFGLTRAATPLAIGTLPEGSRVLLVDSGEIRSGLISVEEVKYEDYASKTVMLNNEQVYGHYYPLTTVGSIYADGPNLNLSNESVLFCSEDSVYINDAEDQIMAAGSELAAEHHAHLLEDRSDLSNLPDGSQLIVVRSDGITAGKVRVFSGKLIGNLEGTSLYLNGRCVQTISRWLNTGASATVIHASDDTEFYV